MFIKTARRAIVLACAASAFLLAAGATTAHADKTKRHVKKDNYIGLSVTSEKTNDTGGNTSIYSEENNIDGKIVRSETWAETTRTISIDGQNYLLVTCQGCSKQSLEWIVESKKNFSSLPIAVEVEDAETDIKGADVILRRRQTNYIPPCIGSNKLGIGAASSF